MLWLAMDRVLQKNHVIGGQSVTLLPYFPTLGVIPPGFDSSLPQQPIPADVIIECAPEIIHFAKENKALKHKVHSLYDFSISVSGDLVYKVQLLK